MEGLFSLLRTFLFMRMQHMHGDLTLPRWAAQASRTCKRPGWENRMLQTAAELSLKLLSYFYQIIIQEYPSISLIICQFWEDLADLDARANEVRFSFHEIKTMLRGSKPQQVREPVLSWTSPFVQMPGTCEG